MTQVARILVPIDFPPVCDRALKQAVAIAARSGAELHVVHVQVLYWEKYGWAAIPNLEELENDVPNLCRSDLDEVVANISTPVIREVVRDVKEAPAIVHYAEAHKIDLIAMDTHARKGISRLFLGSVTSGVLHQSPASVIVVGPDFEIHEDHYRRVLAPVDFSESSIAALQQAATIASQHDAELIVLHVVDSPQAVPYAGVVESPEVFRERAVRALDDLLGATDLSKQPTRRLVVMGFPSEQITTQARELDVDLIVMGTVGASGLRRLLLGSTTERVLRDAPCAVLAHRGSVLENL